MSFLLWLVRHVGFKLQECWSTKIRLWDAARTEISAFLRNIVLFPTIQFMHIENNQSTVV